MTTDPFAALYSAGPQTQLYISGRLTLLRIPFNAAGEWISINSTWHRRLTADAFLWLRSAVSQAIESGRITEEFSDASQTLEQIATIGIESGSFTADEISPHCTAPDWFSFNAGVPLWADTVDDFTIAQLTSKNKNTTLKQ